MSRDRDITMGPYFDITSDYEDCEAPPPGGARRTEDPTAFSRAVRDWARSEMLERIVGILGLSDGDDPVEAVRQLKRRAEALDEGRPRPVRERTERLKDGGVEASRAWRAAVEAGMHDLRARLTAVERRLAEDGP